MGFQLPKLTKCCFCATLRTGALIIGYISCVVSFLSILLYIALIVAVSKFVSDHTNKPPEGHTENEVTTFSVILYVLFSMKILLLVFYFVVSILLVIGAHKQRPQLMKYYFIVGVVNLIFGLILIVANFIFTGFISTVIDLISSAIVFYVLLVVRSAYLEMEERQRPQPKVFEMNIIERQQQPLMT